MWPLDIGLHRFLGESPIHAVSKSDEREFEPDDMVLVEVTEEDLTDTTSYKPGFYSSPYSPREAVRRLGPPAWEGA
jgi:hypothetical protein